MANFTLYENGTLVISSDHKRKAPKKENGLKQKSYFIDSDTYRKIASSAVNLWEKKKHKLTFFTLTFPFDANETQANECFSKFVENLKKNYELKNYIAVKERGEQYHRLHFHAIFDICWHDIRTLNAAWCKTFSHLADFSSCAVRLPTSSSGGAVIRSQKRCVKYLCKYLGKQKDREVFEKPCVFISRDILSKPLKVEQSKIEELKARYKHRAFITKYTTYISFFSDEHRTQQIYFSDKQKKVDFLQ